VKIATWNMKQAVAPKKKLHDLWEWADQVIDADVLALTEAKAPADLGQDWSVLFDPAGIYSKGGNCWGTVLASRKVELRPVSGVKKVFRSKSLHFTWPAAVQVADIYDTNERWGTIVGMYAVTRDGQNNDVKSGRWSLPHLLGQLEDLFDSRLGDRVVVAGDFNLWPFEVQRHLRGFDLTDLVEHTASSRRPLDKCANCELLTQRGRAVNECGHLWTHRNGNQPGAKRQQIDYILCTSSLLREFRFLSGGLADFPDSFDISDHAPVVAEFC